MEGINVECCQRMLKCISCDIPEVRVAVLDRSKPGILNLFIAPLLNEFSFLSFWNV